jgi:mRNA interferase MazF
MSTQIFTNGNKGDYEVKRGEIYYILQGDIYEEVGSEQRSGRPGIIVSNNQNNIHSDCVEVVLLTTRPKTSLPTHVNVNTAQYPSIALCEQVKTYSKQRLGDYIGTVSADELLDINTALSISLSLPVAEVGAMQAETLQAANEALESELSQMENKYMQVVCEIEDLKKQAKEMPATNAQKYKIERDVYKKMYEQLLNRVMAGNEADV